MTRDDRLSYVHVLLVDVRDDQDEHLAAGLGGAGLFLLAGARIKLMGRTIEVRPAHGRRLVVRVEEASRVDG